MQRPKRSSRRVGSGEAQVDLNRVRAQRMALVTDARVTRNVKPTGSRPTPISDKVRAYPLVARD